MNDALDRLRGIMKECRDEARKQGWEGKDYEFFYTDFDLQYIVKTYGRNPTKGEWRAVGIKFVNHQYVEEHEPECSICRGRHGLETLHAAEWRLCMPQNEWRHGTCSWCSTEDVLVREGFNPEQTYCEICYRIPHIATGGWQCFVQRGSTQEQVHLAELSQAICWLGNHIIKKIQHEA